MPSASVYGMDGEIVREEELDDYVFAAPVNMAVLHQVVTSQFVNRRQGNASTKTRAHVSGGNKKPFRQKGTGRARQGSTRSPQWRGGGSVFGPRPHSYDRAIPRKMKRLALRSALSDKAANNAIILMDELTFEQPRTRDMEELIARLPIARNVLLLLPERDENVILSARNIQRVKLGNVASLNVVELLKYDRLMMPMASVERIVEMFGQDADDALQMKRHPKVVLRRQTRRADQAAKQERLATARAARGGNTTATDEAGE
ncbi:MAG TPA: 50S ribosomal protein L4 [Ktedonobacterales bacterium]|nr:50S ribosomal protein L4 [Ktedonobacterales bacterium]